jgi:predicted transcriptional regulator
MKFLIGAVILLTALLLLSPLLMPAFNGTGEYVVKPGSGIPGGTVAVDAAAVSFWQLPLWVQVAGTIDGILILIGLLNAAPFVIGKIQNVLDNRNRLNIFNYVISNPGCTQSEISSRQNMKNGTVKYHVQMLEAQGKIILKRMGKYTRLFNTSRANSELEKMVLSYVKNETSKNLLYSILEEPGVTNQRLSERFCLDKSSVHWHMERFLNDNLIRFEQDGRYKKYFVEPDVSKLLNGDRVRPGAGLL